MRDLFRDEVVRHRSERLYGRVALALPVSWQVIGAFLFVGPAAALAFASVATYTRVEAVAGEIVAQQGIAEIVPPRAGTIAAIEVHDGDAVTAGQPLARIRAVESTARGVPLATEVDATLVQQDAGLSGQASQIESAAKAQRERIGAEILGLSDEIARLDEQIADQRQLMQGAKSEFDRARSVAARGFISRRDLQMREDSFVSRRQQLAQLRQSRAGKQAALTEAQRSLTESAAQARSQVSSIRSARGAIAERRVSSNAFGTYVLTSPANGTVTGVSGREGQPARPDQPIMALLPEGGGLRAELFVPTYASGFLEKGQTVILSVDAFPFQQFGTLNGQVEVISAAPVTRQKEAGGTEAGYIVQASIRNPKVRAFGRLRPLIAGMRISARIVTRRESLLEWLFEPLLAVSRR
ncbi:MAG TPA: HlyD family efflux transporter periplasmic adaptor subunit [Allosphingosinicella sp.]|jgi:membrane fusion protein